MVITQSYLQKIGATTNLYWLLCQSYRKVRIVHATVLAFHYDYWRKVSTKAACDFHLIKYGIGMIYNLY